MNESAAPTDSCAKCGGELVITVKRKYSLLDLFGVAVLGSFVFGLLALFISSSHIGRALIFLLWVGGLVAFGLYHMIGFREIAKSKCTQCGEVLEKDISA